MPNPASSQISTYQTEGTIDKSIFTENDLKRWVQSLKSIPGHPFNYEAAIEGDITDAMEDEDLPEEVDDTGCSGEEEIQGAVKELKELYSPYWPEHSSPVVSLKDLQVKAKKWQFDWDLVYIHLVGVDCNVEAGTILGNLETSLKAEDFVIADVLDDLTVALDIVVDQPLLVAPAQLETPPVTPYSSAIHKPQTSTYFQASELLLSVSTAVQANSMELYPSLPPTQLGVYYT
ncbi:hypothetical protein GYMLUDRAFT_253930 [Collybiopsis luxurians FD-317 M1]|nr:hypothetical protein GYMLUDRAFT_253930 [Collybiopsis luxurians FD-317 M1]